MIKKQRYLRMTDVYRQRIRFESQYKNATRAQYIALVKRMGIHDICECEPFEWVSGRRRANSGVNGMLECSDCFCLIYPLMYMYACDECTEATLATESFQPIKPDFYCEDCQAELKWG